MALLVRSDPMRGARENRRRRDAKREVALVGPTDELRRAADRAHDLRSRGEKRDDSHGSRGYQATSTSVGDPPSFFDACNGALGGEPLRGKATKAQPVAPILNRQDP